MRRNINKLILGTAQFDGSYGIKNTKKKTYNHNKILTEAKKNKIDYLDTSPLYGKSEKKIGNFQSKFKIISKIPKIPNNSIDPTKWVLDNTYKTIKNLKQKKIYAMLIHNASDLKGKNGKKIYEGLKIIKKKKIIKKIGISIYSFNDLNWILKKYKFDIVQAPFNIFDRRLISSGWLNKLKRKKIEVHCRSIFLQGLILIDKKKFPKKFSHHFKKWFTFLEWSKNNKVRPIQSALSYVLSFKSIDKIIIGVDNCEQLNDVIKNFKKIKILIPKKFATKDKKIINPSLW